MKGRFHKIEVNIIVKTHSLIQMQDSPTIKNKKHRSEKTLLYLISMSYNAEVNLMENK